MNITKSLLIIGIVAVVGGAAATAAYFTYQVNANNNSVTTGTLTFSLNNIGSGDAGPALAAGNMYPGTFAESAGQIKNTGSIKMNPSISLAGASDPNGLASKLWLQIWTEGKLWYNDWITNAPGYTSGKITLDSLVKDQTVNVAFRLILDESAEVSGTYSVNVVVTGYQWNDPAGAPTTPTATGSEYIANDWSYNVCGTRPSNSYYTFNENVWKIQTKPFTATGTQSDGSCIVSD